MVDKIKGLTAHQKQRVKTLAKQKFIDQKLIEILLGVVGIIVLVLIPPFLGHLIFPSPETCAKHTNHAEGYECSAFDYWLPGFVTLLLGVVLIFGSIKLIGLWIKSNWEKAYDRAEEELDLPNQSYKDKYREDWDYD